MSGKTRGILAVTLVAMLWLSLSSGSSSAAGPNGITNPQDGMTVGGSIYVDGIADDPQFAAWQLDLLPGGDPRQAIFLNRGTNPNRTAGPFKRVDTTSYPDGGYGLRLRVVKKDGNYDEYFISVTINNVGLAVRNGVTYPSDGDTVQCVVSIRGFADHPNFAKWQLDLLPGGDTSQVVFLDRGFSANRSGRIFTTLDTAVFPNGPYRLRLRVVRQDSNYDEYWTSFTIYNMAPVASTCQALETGSRPLAPASPIGFNNPQNGATVRGTVTVSGIADDPNFVEWQVDLLFGGDAKRAISIARGKSRNKNGSAFTELDTAMLPDGPYALRLSIRRKDDSLVQQTIQITIANRLATPTPAVHCVEYPFRQLPKIILETLVVVMKPILPYFCEFL